MRRLRVLGPLEVDGAAEVLGPRDRVVVSALALRPGERVDAETLAEALWGEAPPASAAKVVQGCISRLRRALGTDAIQTVDGGYRVRSDELDIDRQQFEDQVQRARGYLATRTPERAIPMLVDALALWRGPAFGELEDWMPGRLEAVRLGQLRLAAEEDLLQARLDCGDHAGVAADGTVLTGQQPFRERRWALLALAQYRSGRQADALGSIRAARRALGQELGLDPGSELVLLEQRILAQDPGLATDHEARLADAPCPWKGLAPYGEQDGDTFFGRAADVAACLARLGESPLLVVTGPSGSGKSSLVQAGLVPALRACGAEVEVFTPGADGAVAMAAARSRRTGEPLLVIDQFEETFTLRGTTFARPWLGELARYAQDAAPVVVVVRGDHVAELGADAELARLAERGLHLVAPLTGEMLRAAVEGPAQVAGLRWEPGLVDLVVRDADGQPGALPLLSHALTETWLRREGGLLTVDGYQAAGGIGDAVAASAERLYEGLSPDERGELRWLMLRLVSLSDSGEPFRTPLPASVVGALDPVRRRLLDLLVRGRLVTSADGGYDLAHEALVRAWPRLRDWLDEDRVGQQIRRHLAMAAAGWEALDRPDTELYRGSRLTNALDWLERGHEPLDETQQDFIEASRAVAADDVRRLAADAGRQRRQNRRLRWLVAAAVVLLVASTLAGWSALDRGREAERGRRAAADSAAAAATSAAAARHESVVARSLALLSTSKRTAALMAVQSWSDRPDVLAESALVASLTADPGLLGYRAIAHGNEFQLPVAAADVPDGSGSILVAIGSAVAFADQISGRPEPPLQRSGAATLYPSVLSVSADGSRAAQLLTTSVDPRCDGGIGAERNGCTALVVYDLATRAAVLGPLPTPFLGADVAISHDGTLVAVAGSRGEVATWDVARRARLGGAERRARLSEVPDAPRGSGAVAFGRGDLLYVGSTAGILREASARTLRVRRTWRVPPLTTNHRIVVLDARDRLVAGGDHGQLAVDLRDDRVLWTAETAGSEGSECHTLAVSVRLETVYCGTDTGQVVMRDLDTGERAGRQLEPQLGEIGALVVTHRGGVLLAFGAEQADFASWRLDGPGVGGRLLVAGRDAAGGYDPTGRMLLVRDRRTGINEIVHADTGNPLLRISVPGAAVWLSSNTVGVLGRRPVLVDIPSGEMRDTGLVGSTEALYPEPGETHAWAVSRASGLYTLRRVSLSTGQVGTTISVERAQAVRLVSDGANLFVTTKGLDGEWGTTRYDSTSGTALDGGLGGKSRVAIAPDHSFVTSDETGVLRAYRDFIFKATAAYPPVGGAGTSIQLSADGSRLLVTAANQTAQLYDVASQSRIGVPIQTHGSVGAIHAWLRPDGQALITDTRDGVVEWNLDPDAMLEATCELAGRNWTPIEWSTYVGDSAYQTNCAQFGVPGAGDQHPDE